MRIVRDVPRNGAVSIGFLYWHETGYARVVVLILGKRTLAIEFGSGAGYDW